MNITPGANNNNKKKLLNICSLYQNLSKLFIKYPNRKLTYRPVSPTQSWSTSSWCQVSRTLVRFTRRLKGLSARWVVLCLRIRFRTVWWVFPKARNFFVSGDMSSFDPTTVWGACKLLLASFLLIWFLLFLAGNDCSVDQEESFHCGL